MYTICYCLIFYGYQFPRYESPYNSSPPSLNFLAQLSLGLLVYLLWVITNNCTNLTCMELFCLIWRGCIIYFSTILRYSTLTFPTVSYIEMNLMVNFSSIIFYGYISGFVLSIFLWKHYKCYEVSSKIHIVMAYNNKYNNKKIL